MYTCVCVCVCSEEQRSRVRICGRCDNNMDSCNHEWTELPPHRCKDSSTGLVTSGQRSYRGRDFLCRVRCSFCSMILLPCAYRELLGEASSIFLACRRRAHVTFNSGAVGAGLRSWSFRVGAFGSLTVSQVSSGGRGGHHIGGPLTALHSLCFWQCVAMVTFPLLCHSSPILLSLVKNVSPLVWFHLISSPLSVSPCLLVSLTCLFPSHSLCLPFCACIPLHALSLVIC